MLTRAIDPGNPTSYVADAIDGVLVQLWTFDSTRQVAENLVGMPRGSSPGLSDTVAIERPTIYPKGHLRPNDLMGLAWSGGQALQALRGSATVKEYAPREWKGQLPKCVSHNRLWAKLTPAERALFPADTEARIVAACQELGKTGKLRRYSWHWHNALDAAALCLHVLGRSA